MYEHAWSSESNGRFSSRVEEWMYNAETEIRQAVAYVDRVVVPEVRREAGGAARVLAGYLERLADKLHPVDEPGGKQGL